MKIQQFILLSAAAALTAATCQAQNVLLPVKVKIKDFKKKEFSHVPWA